MRQEGKQFSLRVSAVHPGPNVQLAGREWYLEPARWQWGWMVGAKWQLHNQECQASRGGPKAEPRVHWPTRDLEGKEPVKEQGGGGGICHLEEV